ncbi:hypothetical protein P9112_007867 [Eukaryota sp. TZLM1-RC]
MIQHIFIRKLDLLSLMTRNVCLLGHVMIVITNSTLLTEVLYHHFCNTNFYIHSSRCSMVLYILCYFAFVTIHLDSEFLLPLLLSLSFQQLPCF